MLILQRSLNGIINQLVLRKNINLLRAQGDILADGKAVLRRFTAGEGNMNFAAAARLHT